MKRNIFTTAEGEQVIAQRPNAAALIWIGAALGAAISANEGIASGLSIISYVSGIIWALLEITYGVNTFRRLLGGLVLIILLLLILVRILAA